MVDSPGATISSLLCELDEGPADMDDAEGMWTAPAAAAVRVAFATDVRGVALGVKRLWEALSGGLATREGADTAGGLRPR
jgi:hypothetical protein